MFEALVWKHEWLPSWLMRARELARLGSPPVADRLTRHDSPSPVSTTAAAGRAAATGSAISPPSTATATDRCRRFILEPLPATTTRGTCASPPPRFYAPLTGRT